MPYYINYCGALIYLKEICVAVWQSSSTGVKVVVKVGRSKNVKDDKAPHLCAYWVIAMHSGTTWTNSSICFMLSTLCSSCTQKYLQWLLFRYTEQPRHSCWTCNTGSFFFVYMWPCIVTNKTNSCTNFPNLFWLKNEPLHVSSSSSACPQESINCTLGTGMHHTVWRQLPSWAILA